MSISEKTKEALTKDIPSFQEAVREFLNKNLSVAEFKGISGNFGSYAERGANSVMLRLRFPGGRIQPYQYPFLIDMIKKHSISLVHFTTGQTIQLHRLGVDAVCDIIDQCADYGIYTRGGGGDNPRNVAAPPLRGVDPAEYFDVSPYVEATNAYLLSLIGSIHLPRKLKVGFTATKANETHATFRDLGFVGQPDGSFHVYSAGGLGPNPRMGVQVGEDISPQDVLYYVKAMVLTFQEKGNYEKRGRARSRYIPMDLGEDVFKQTFAANLELARKEDLTIPSTVPLATETMKTGPLLASHELTPRIHEQKQSGLYYVTYHPLGGSPNPAVFTALLETLSRMEGTELRLASDETAYIINLTGEEAKKVVDITTDSATNEMETSVSCVGASVCQIGLQDSHGLLETIIAETKSHGFAPTTLPKIHISGCPSSCGTHQIGIIGLHGAMKVVDKVPVRSFAVTIGGNDRLGQENFGEEIGIVPVERIPALFVTLGKAVEASHMDFATWITHNEEAFKSMVASFE